MYVYVGWCMYLVQTGVVLVVVLVYTMLSWTGPAGPARRAPLSYLQAVGEITSD